MQRQRRRRTAREHVGLQRMQQGVARWFAVELGFGGRLHQVVGEQLRVELASRRAPGLQQRVVVRGGGERGGQRLGTVRAEQSEQRVHVAPVRSAGRGDGKG